MEVLTKINILLGSLVLYSALLLALLGATLAAIGYAFWSGWQMFKKA